MLIVDVGYAAVIIITTEVWYYVNEDALNQNFDQSAQAAGVLCVKNSSIRMFTTIFHASI